MPWNTAVHNNWEQSIWTKGTFLFLGKKIQLSLGGLFKNIHIILQQMMTSKAEFNVQSIDKNQRT